VVTSVDGLRRRVVVTGLGPVSSIGTGADEFGRALREGRCGTGPVESFEAVGLPSTVGGAIPDFAPEAILRRPAPQAQQWGRSALFAAAAARLAADDAGQDLAGSRAAVVFGTTSGETPAIVQMVQRWHREGYGEPEPRVAAQVPASRLALAAAGELGTRGEVITLGAACAAGNYALGYAYDLLSTGEADVAVAGGTDSMDWLTHAGFHRTGALAQEACRPFDMDRDGVVPGEGGSALVLEEFGHAEARGARIYAEVLGWAMTCDAISPNAQDAESIARCIRAAHRRAGVAADEVDYICAHGTGTRMNDFVEAEAVRAVFGRKPPPISSIKSMLGHSMGAAASFGAIACVLSISGGFLPPTVNHRVIDPELDGLDVVPNLSREQTVRVAQNNGFGFGGNNAVALLGSVR
jgi:3-oxoacyl-[acyl-carrier-protein] synthase II